MTQLNEKEKRRALNEICAQYLKELVRLGSAQVDAPDGLEFLGVEIFQPLAQDCLCLRIDIRNKEDLYVNELYLDVDLY